MNFKKILTALLALALSASTFAMLASCDGGEDECSAHRDADDNALCDSCGAEFEDGAENTDVNPEPETASCTLSVIDSDGLAVSGAKFTLTMDGESVTLTAGTDGKAAAELKVGEYSVMFDYSSLPSGYLPDTGEIEVTKDSAAITLSVINNNPNGTPARPYVISEDVTALTLEAGEELYYSYHGAANRKLEIRSAGVTVTYNDTVYEPTDGVISIQLTEKVGSSTRFSVKNVTTAKVETEIELISPLGSIENPIPLTESTTTVTVPAEGLIHYKWTVEADGVLVVSSANEKNNIGITKTLENNIPISSQTNGSAGAYMTVSAGETVTISVASLDTKNDTEITFSVNAYAGTETDPVPLIKDSIDIVLPASDSVTMTTDKANATLTIEGEPDVTVTYGGTTYTPDSDGNITVTLTDSGAAFTVNSNAETTNTITLDITEAE